MPEQGKSFAARSRHGPELRVTAEIGFRVETLLRAAYGNPCYGVNENSALGEDGPRAFRHDGRGDQNESPTKSGFRF